MTFREQNPIVGEDYEGAYTSRDVHPDLARNNPLSKSEDKCNCLDQFTWLTNLFSRIRTWLFTLGRGYVYFLVIIILITLLPTLLVRD